MADGGCKLSGFSGRTTGGNTRLFWLKAAVGSTPGSGRWRRARRGKTKPDRTLPAPRSLPCAGGPFDLDRRHPSPKIGPMAMTALARFALLSRMTENHDAHATAGRSYL